MPCAVRTHEQRLHQNHAAVTKLTDRNVILVKGEVVWTGAGGELGEEMLQKYLGV